jgi:hypothetical protein
MRRNRQQHANKTPLMAITLPQHPDGTPELEGVRAKIGRAEYHVLDLHSRGMATLDTKGETLPPKVEVNSKGHVERTTFRHPKPRPLDPTLPLIIGDCIHNLRSALDHLVYQLAILNGAGPDAAGKTSFPIYLRPNMFQDVVSKKVAPFISGTALTEIDKLQPYKTPDPENCTLWKLSQLDNFDKHRLLLVVAQEFRLNSWRITAGGETHSGVTPDSKWKPCIEGAEIMVMETIGGAEMNMQAEVATAIKFSNTAAFCNGHIVEDVLKECGLEVHRIIDHFGKMFFGE